GQRDSRLQAKSASKQSSRKGDEKSAVRHIPQAPSALFFKANQALGPPYHIILDTNFFFHTVRSKIDILTGLMDLLLAKCVPIVGLILRTYTSTSWFDPILNRRLLHAEPILLQIPFAEAKLL